ncbi:MAG: DNA (cytosine-5-)-methyltransferase [Dehalococcoidia bacterium]
MRSIELFTGAGGLALGIHLAGFEHQLLVEADDDACETLVHNSKNETVSGISRWPIVRDLVELVDLSSYQKIDLLAAGIPCQPFSNGGKRGGIEDDRNMFPVFARVLAALKPQAFLLENVNGLINGKLASHMEYIILQLRHPWNLARNGQTWKDHLEELRYITEKDIRKDTDYKVYFQVLDAANYGIPQIRKRVFVVGFRRDLETNWNFPTATHSKEALLTNNKKAWLTVRDAIRGLPKSGTKAAAGIQHVMVPGARSYKGHTGSVLDWPAKSLKAGNHGVGGGENTLRYQNGRVRYFTVRECARLQTFPDSWVFKGPWSSVTRQIGNAVPVKMATVVAKSIRELLGNSVE